MSNEALGSLDAGEQAHFDTAGEAELPESTGAEEAQQEEQEGGEQAESQEGAEQQEQTTKTEKTVPLAALHEERQRNREMRERQKALEEQVRIGNERMQQLFAMAQRGQQPQVPAFDQDPATNLHARLSQIEQYAQQTASQQQAEVQRHQAEAQRQAAIQELHRDLDSQEQEYRQVNPDYDNATKFLIEQESKSLQAMGYAPQAINQIIQNQLGSLAWELRAAGRSVPESVYALAQARGYQKQGGITPQQRIQGLQKGTAAAKSLGSSGAAAGKLDLAALAAMPASDFAELTKDDKAWRQLMGG